MDLTDIDLLVLYAVTGRYALSDLFSKEDRVLATMLSSRAEYIEACVWELRQRYPDYTRAPKVSRRFRHSHERRVPKKDACPKVRHFRNDEHSQLPHPSEYGYLVKRSRFSDHEGRHLAEELMHARELDDLAALEHDEWVLDLAYEDEYNRAWQEEEDAFWDSLGPWWAPHEEAEDFLFAEMRECVEEAPLVQVDTWDGPCMRVTEVDYV